MDDDDVLLPDDLSPMVIFTTAPPTFDEIVKAVCGHYEIMPAHIATRSDRQASLARQLVCHIARSIRGCNVVDLEPIVGRSASNISSLINKIEGRLSVEELLRDDLDVIKRRLAHAITQRKWPQRH